MDEIDGYPSDIDGEGDPILLAERRTATFSKRKKIFLVSTPTIKGLSNIEREFGITDQRYYVVPCPYCHKFQRLVWEKDPTRRNEALDCRVYARAAAAIYGLDRMSERGWQELEALIPSQDEAKKIRKQQWFIQMSPTKVDNPWL